MVHRQRRNHSAPRRRRKYYVADHEMSCSHPGCVVPIQAGQRYIQGLTKEPWHPSCRKAAIYVPEPANPNRDSPLARLPKPEPECTGCHEPVRADERQVHTFSECWHKDCYDFDRKIRCRR